MLLLDELLEELVDELLDEEELLLLEAARPELELPDELLEELLLVLPSGPLQAAKAIKLVNKMLRESMFSTCIKCP